jgi:hypothetical protein
VNPAPPKENITMTRPASDPDEQARAYRAAGQAVLGLARERGAELTTRPLFPSAEVTVRDVDPLAGARAARDIELGSRRSARDYIRAAREAGHGWGQIGEALGMTKDTDRTGETIAEAAYTYAAGDPGTETAMWYGRSFPWRCPSCSQAISDRGQVAGPADNEPGHADKCARLAAAVAEWDASWEAEP